MSITKLEQIKRFEKAARIVQNGDIGLLVKWLIEVENKLDTKISEPIETAEEETKEELILTKFDKKQVAEALCEDKAFNIRIANSLPFEEIAARAASKITVVHGKTPSRRELIDLMVPLIPEPIDPSESIHESMESMMMRLRKMIPSMDNFATNLTMYGERIRDGLELLNGDDRLEITAIKGLDEWMSDFSAKFNDYTPKGTGAKGGYGGARKLSVLLDVQISNPQIGDSLTYDGVKWVNGPAGGGLTRLNTTSGAVNGINKLFGFTELPTYIVADGVWYDQNDMQTIPGVNWSWNSGTLTATMKIAPQSAIWGFK